MRVFLDFEATSLAKMGTPIEVAWVFEDGRGESHLIRPAPGWNDWDVRAEAIHRIPREQLLREGAPHDTVAARMVQALDGHDLYASAPSWDGKWMSALLRGSGFERHRLRLRASDIAFAKRARDELASSVPAEGLDAAVQAVLLRVTTEFRQRPVAHRALADAREDWARWVAVGEAARAAAQPSTVSGTVPNNPA